MSKTTPPQIIFTPEPSAFCPYFGPFLAQPYYASERVFNRLRGKIHWRPNLLGQYVVAIRSERIPETDDGFFLTPTGEYWANGCDDAHEAAYSIAFFPDIGEALNAVFLTMPADARHAGFFRAEQNGGTLLLRECYCLGLNPSERQFDVESYRAPDCDFDLDTWRIARWPELAATE